MQKYKYYAKKHTALCCVSFLLFLFMWFYYCYSFLDLPNQTDFHSKITDRDILAYLFSENYQGYRFMAILSLPFAFAINYLLGSENPLTISRMGSRGKYIKSCLFNIFIFAFLFAFLHEAVNMICIFSFFPSALIWELKLPAYTLINILSLFIYFARMGGIFLLVRFFVNPKFSPFIVLILYYLESSIETDLPLPLHDSIVIFDLITGNKNIIDIIILFVRGMCLTTVIFIAAYFKFQKKDIMKHEKQ